MKKIFMFIAMAMVAVGVSFNASAQENGNRDENGNVVRGPYETNDFRSNWFVSGGLGIDSFNGSGFNGGIGLATDLYVGKWFTPTIGVRAGWNGLTNKSTVEDVTTKYWNNSITGELLWNVSNTFGGYKQDRTWNVIAYPSFGFLTSAERGVSGVDCEFGAGAGVINSFKVTDRLNIDLDLKALVTKKSFLTTIDKDYCGLLPSLTLGVTYNFGRKGKTGFVRHSSIPVACTFAEYELLKNKNQKLSDENTALRKENEALKGRKPQIDTVTLTKMVTDPRALIVTYSIGTSKLTPVAEAQVANYAETIADSETITIVGSADSGTGSAKRNQYLAERRAEAVKNVLVKAGVSEDRITTATALDTNKSNLLSRAAVVTKR